jgi:hypothetical protein
MRNFRNSGFWDDVQGARRTATGMHFRYMRIASTVQRGNSPKTEFMELLS